MHLLYLNLRDENTLLTLVKFIKQNYTLCHINLGKLGVLPSFPIFANNFFAAFFYQPPTIAVTPALCWFVFLAICLKRHSQCVDNEHIVNKAYR